MLRGKTEMLIERSGRKGGWWLKVLLRVNALEWPERPG